MSALLVYITTESSPRLAGRHEWPARAGSPDHDPDRVAGTAMHRKLTNRAIPWPVPSRPTAAAALNRTLNALIHHGFLRRNWTIISHTGGRHTSPGGTLRRGPRRTGGKGRVRHRQRLADRWRTGDCHRHRSRHGQGRGADGAARAV